MKKRFLSALLAFCMALTLLPSVAVAAPAITVNTEADLISAIADIDENGTITLGADIPLANTLAIGGTKSFVIDLNGNTLSCSKLVNVIQHSGTGTLTITDSSALGGGKVETATFGVTTIVSSGNGKLIISGKATVSSAYDTINILSSGTPAPVVLEMTGGTVTGPNTSNAIANTSTGAVHVTGGTITGGNGIASQYGAVNVSGGTVTGYLDSAIYAFNATVTLSGGTFRKIYSGYSGTAIRCATLVISGGSVIIDGDNGATYAVPNLSGYTSYQWRTSSTGPYTLSTAQAYSYSSSQKYIEFKPYTPPPATYTVTYQPGTDGTGSNAADTKTQDVALTLRGAAFTRGGFTQTGWATTDGGAKAYDLGGSYTANAAIDLYPVWTSGTLVSTEAELISAITNVAANGTIKLTGDIALTSALVINGSKPFVIDLNGNTLSRNGMVIEYSGTGALTITDSSALGGGKVETTAASTSAIESSGIGKLVISGKATISSAYDTITILAPVTPSATVLEMTGGTVVSTATANSAISNNSYGQINVLGGTITGGNGIVSISGGPVIVAGGTVTGTSGNAIRSDSGGIYGGTITLMGGTIESTGSMCAIYCDASSQINIPRGSVIINGTAGAMNIAPNLTSYASYQWRTSSTGEYTLSTTQAYTYNSSQTYVEFKPYTPATYTVAYHPGTNGTGSNAADTKTQDVALTLRGATFTRGGFTQTGWATTDGGAKSYDLGGSYTANAAIDLYPVWAAESVLALTATPADQQIVGSSVTLTATLTGFLAGPGVDGQTITFKNGGTTLGTANLNSGGVATYTWTPSAGTYSLTAEYAATAYNTAATSSTVNYTVIGGSDSAAVAAAKTAAQAASYVDMTQTVATDEDAIKAGLKNIAETAVHNSGVTITINKVSYTAPIEGTSADPSGTNGSYTFTVTVSKGGQSETTGQKTIVITATVYTGGTGGNGNTGGSDTPSKPADTKPTEPVAGSTESKATVDNKGNASVSLTDKNITDAIADAKAEAAKKGVNAGDITAVIHVTTGGTKANTVTVNLPKTTQEQVIGNKIASVELVIDRPDLTIGIDLAAVTEINRQAKADVQLFATRMDNVKLSGDAKAAIGKRPAFDLKAIYGSGMYVTDFGKGSVSVEIPYTLQKGEIAGNVYAAYVDSMGKVTYLTDSSYDAKRGTVVFSTNHLSTYGIAYKARFKFTDINGHWAKDDMLFVANRGLMTGTSATKFSPNGSMTRGMFVTALGRLANVDTSTYKQSSFTDVKADAYYMGYIEWGVKNNILVGNGGKFDPEGIVTREQMAVIMDRYATAIGFKLPEVHAQNVFADNAKIGAWAALSVKRTQMAGIIQSKSKNLYDPQGTATRAEVSAVLRRFVELTVFSDTAQGWVKNDSGQWMFFKNGKALT